MVLSCSPNHLSKEIVKHRDVRNMQENSKREAGEEKVTETGKNIES